MANPISAAFGSRATSMRAAPVRGAEAAATIS